MHLGQDILLRWRAYAGTESQIESQVMTQVDTAFYVTNFVQVQWGWEGSGKKGIKVNRPMLCRTLSVRPRARTFLQFVINPKKTQNRM
jgi:hypothetical protein